MVGIAGVLEIGVTFTPVACPTLESPGGSVVVLTLPAARLGSDVVGVPPAELGSVVMDVDGWCEGWLSPIDEPDVGGIETLPLAFPLSGLETVVTSGGDFGVP